MLKPHAHELSVIEDVHEVKRESIPGRVLKNSFYKGGIPGPRHLALMFGKKHLPGP